MNHRDAELTDVVIVLDDLDTQSMAKVVSDLKTAGLEVTNVNDENSVVEGCIETQKVHALQKVDCVRYVRSVLTYTVDYPPGDPRDKDGPEEALYDREE